MGLDINDVGYARGGVGIDSAGPGDGFPAYAKEAKGWGGEWHFHVFGETVGLFAMDIHQGSAGLKVGRPGESSYGVGTLVKWQVQPLTG